MAGDSWRREKGQVPDGRRPQGEAGGPLRLRDWLVAQIESGRYAGLRWEDASKTLFRIPWKHAAKQDYRAQQDAALFRVRGCNEGPLTYTRPPLRGSPGVSVRTPLPMDLPFPTSLGSCPAGVGGEFRHHHSGEVLQLPFARPHSEDLACWRPPGWRSPNSAITHCLQTGFFTPLTFNLWNLSSEPLNSLATFPHTQTPSPLIPASPASSSFPGKHPKKASWSPAPLS